MIRRPPGSPVTDPLFPFTTLCRSQLSSSICSLRAVEDRAAMAGHRIVNAAGKVTSWRFSRSVIRVAAVLAYEDAQAAIDGGKDHALLEPALKIGRAPV